MAAEPPPDEPEDAAAAAGGERQGGQGGQGGEGRQSLRDHQYSSFADSTADVVDQPWDPVLCTRSDGSTTRRLSA